MRNLRRQSHDMCQRGQKQAREGEGCRGQSEGSREVPMVRTPAGPLGSRTPSRGRSQRRDTGRGPAFRCVRISTQIIHQKQGRCAALTAHTHMRTRDSNGATSRARAHGHFGAALVLWPEELEDREASVHALLRRPVT